MAPRIVKKTILLIFSCMSFFTFTLVAQKKTDLHDAIANALAGFITPNAKIITFRSLYIPFGGRSEAMASAFTAMSDDISFLHYNPATSAVLPDTELAIFHTFLPGNSGIDTIAFSKRNNNGGYGVSLKNFYVPFIELNNAKRRISLGYYSEIIATFNLSYNFLIGYNFKGIAVGANFKLGFRGIPIHSNNLKDKIEDDTNLTNSTLAFMGDIGILMRFNLGKFYSSREPNFNVGLAIHNLGSSLRIFGVELDSIDPLPSYASIGISYRIINPLIIAIEYQQPFNINNPNEEKFIASLGAEMKITDYIAIQAGFLMRGLNPKVTLGTSFEQNNLTLNVAYSLDLPVASEPINRISLSAKISFENKGKSLVQSEVDRLYSDGLRFYNNGEFEESIKVWNKALTLLPRFDPAKNAIHTAENAIKLRDNMQSIE